MSGSEQRRKRAEELAESEGAPVIQGAQKGLKSSAIKALFWKLLEQGGMAAVTLIVQVAMAIILSPEEFGELAIMLVFINVGNVMVQSGLNTAIIQSDDVNEQDYSTVFWMCLGAAATVYAIVFLAAPSIAAFYEVPQIVWPLRLLLVILIVNAFNSVQEAIVARELAFKKTAISTAVAGIVSGAMGIGMAISGFGIWSLVAQQLIQQLMKGLVLARQVRWLPRAVFNPARAKKLFGFGWKLLASGLLDQGYQSLTDLIIGKVFSVTDLAYVSQGKKYPFYLGAMLDGVMQPVMLSTVSKVQHEVAYVKRLVSRALKTGTFIIVPAMIAFAIVADSVVLLIFGEKWLPSVPFLRMYCLIYALLPIDTTNLQALNGMGRSDLFLKLEVIKKGLGLATICITAFVFRNIYAIVIGQVISNFVCAFINAYPNKRVIGYDYFEQAKDVFPAFLLAGISGAAALLLGGLNLAPLPMIVLQVVTMAATYLLLARLFKVEALSYLVDTLSEVKIRKTEN